MVIGLRDTLYGSSPTPRRISRFTHLVNVVTTVLVLAFPPLAISQQQQQRSSSKDWQASCDAAAGSAKGYPTTPVRALPQPAWAIDLVVKPRELISVDWDQASKQPVFLDAGDAQVKWVAFDGSIRHTVGRPGEGPGDIRFPPVMAGSKQRLALVGAKYVVVVDGTRGSVFSLDGRFMGGFVPDTNRFGMGADVQVARLDDSTIVVSQSNRWHLGQPFSLRKTMQLVAWRVGSAGAHRIGDLGTLENSAAVFKPFEGLYAEEPYNRLHLRNWGVAAGGIQAVSYRAFGVCRINPSTGQMTVSKVTASPRTVDKSEIERELRVEFGSNPDIVMPNMSVTPRKYLEGKWPTRAPYYFDLLVSETGRALAARLAADGTVVVDSFNAEGAYVGTLRLTTSMALYRFVGSQLIALDYDTGKLAGYVIP